MFEVDEAHPWDPLNQRLTLEFTGNKPFKTFSLDMLCPLGLGCPPSSRRPGRATLTRPTGVGWCGPGGGGSAVRGPMPDEI